MPRPNGFNYDHNDGRPTASHIWEEQFFVAGHRGPPPADALRKRIALLQAAIEEKRASGTWMAGWSRELDWRQRQLELVTKLEGKEADRGDTEHQE